MNKVIAFSPPIEGFQYLQADALSYYNIISGHTVCVPLNTEYFLTRDLILVGDMELIGVLTLLDLDEIHKPHVLTTTADLVITTGHDFILCDASSNAITITLPTAVGNLGKIFNIKTIDATNAVVVDPDGSETIDGSLTKTVLLYSTLKIISNGTEWLII